jgi:SecD/SecF fusion protein
MSKTWLTCLVVGVILVALLFVAAIAAFVFLPNLGALLSSPKGATLVYEVDPDSLAPGQTVDIDNLCKAIDRRLGFGGRLGIVQRVGARRIAVFVMGPNVEDKLRVERLLAAAGNLEFRILANRRDNKALIEKALADPSKTKILGSGGELAAWWAPVKTGEEKGLIGSGDIALRKKKQAGSETTEVLLLNDDYNITGAFLTRADLADSEGRPCVTFGFNRPGGQLFGKLTGSHLPDNLTGFAYRLGIVLDGEVYSAPSIQSTIYDSGEITGSFTPQEVDDLVRILNSGTLPAKLRPVKKRGG